MKILKKFFIRHVKISITDIWDLDNYDNNMLARGSMKLKEEISERIMGLVKDSDFWTLVSSEVHKILKQKNITLTIKEIFESEEEEAEDDEQLKALVMNASLNVVIKLMGNKFGQLSCRDWSHILHFIGINHQNLFNSLLRNNEVNKPSEALSGINHLISVLKKRFEQSISTNLDNLLEKYLNNFEYKLNEDSNNLYLKFEDTQELNEAPEDMICTLYKEVINKVLRSENFEKIEHSRIFCQLSEETLHEIFPTYEKEDCISVEYNIIS